MSAGPAPPNPNAPKKNPRVKQPNAFLRRPGLIVSGVAVFGALALYLNKPPSPRSEPFVSARTQGVQNIEKAYTNAGATGTHTKAYGGTTQGDKESVFLRDPPKDSKGSAVVSGGSGMNKNETAPYSRPGYGDDQRSGSKPKAEEIINSDAYGSKGGK
ncbi:hypothetical protein LTR64_006239 [Lithohypha guttulata]|uniref:uncharacterized protein n=1 Tax=Lithohypha guttulata TaxID=1690604 RepID=UPI002DDEBD93|nr:hypothetical protein LTR51_001963 [Lithohypha guttulata]